MNLFIQNHLTQTSLAIGILFAAIYVIIQALKKNPIKLDNILKHAAGASSIPIGVVLIICAFVPSALSAMSGLPLYIAFAGISLLYISIKQLVSGLLEEDKN